MATYRVIRVIAGDVHSEGTWTKPTQVEAEDFAKTLLSDRLGAQYFVVHVVSRVTGAITPVVTAVP